MTLKPDAFTRGYIDAALWSSTAYGSREEEAADPTHEGTFDRSFQDLGFDWEDLAPETLAEMMADCAEFRLAQTEDLARASMLRPFNRADGTIDEHLGHDFWLSRNGHGAGFFARGSDPVWDRLQEAAGAWGTVDLYVDTTGARDVIRG